MFSSIPITATIYTKYPIDPRIWSEELRCLEGLEPYQTGTQMFIALTGTQHMYIYVCAMGTELTGRPAAPPGIRIKNHVLHPNPQSIAINV